MKRWMIVRMPMSIAVYFYSLYLLDGTVDMGDEIRTRHAFHIHINSGDNLERFHLSLSSSMCTIPSHPISHFLFNTIIQHSFVNPAELMELRN